MLEGGINVESSDVVSCSEVICMGNGEEGTAIDEVDLLWE